VKEGSADRLRYRQSFRHWRWKWRILWGIWWFLVWYKWGRFRRRFGTSCVV